jgi:hypothetical protein
MGPIMHLSKPSLEVFMTRSPPTSAPRSSSSKRREDEEEEEEREEPEEGEEAKTPSATTMVRFPSAAVWAAEAVSVPLSKPLW